MTSEAIEALHQMALAKKLTAFSAISIKQRD